MSTKPTEIIDDVPHQFELLELDLPISVLKDPVVEGHTTEKTSLLAPIVWDDREEVDDVSQTIRDLATKEVTALQDAGFVIEGVDDGTLFKAGTTLWDIGQENLKEYDKEYKKLPLIADAAVVQEALIKEENRIDHFITLSEFRLDGVGWFRKITVDLQTNTMTFNPKEAIPITEVSFGQLRGFSETLVRADAKRSKNKVADEGEAKVRPVTERPPAKSNINSWIGKLGKKQARMRCRTLVGQREVFAFTGYTEGSKRSYVPFDTDKLLREVSSIAPILRADVKYDAETARMRARCLLQAPVDIPAFNGVGRIHQIGFDLCAGDDGTMGIFVQPFVIRVRCRNATLVRNKGLKHSFRHVGSFDKLKDAIQNAINAATVGIETVRDIWSTAATNYFLDEETNGNLTAEEAIARLVAGAHIPTGGLSDEEATMMYIRAWKAEDSPHSAQGVIMAIQRAAHESSWKTKWADEDVEEAASDLLYQKVWTLSSYEDEAE